jgi:hypothetical protein
MAHKMTRFGSFASLALAFSITAGCGSPTTRTGPTPPEEDADEPVTPMKKDAAADRNSGTRDTGGGSEGGASGADGGVDQAGGGGSMDAGPDAYVRTMGGPFGLNARPGPQTCKPPADPTMPPMKLSATGCVDKVDPKKPAASLIPYDVNSPLWSDGASKLRWMAIPDGALVHVKDCMREPDSCKPSAQGGTTPNDGHWNLPVGTVLVKSFSFNGKLLETRLFVRLEDGPEGPQWAGYSYQWNDAQTDATLVDELGVHKTIVGAGGKMQDWFFPGRQDCLTCHNKSVGFALGPETIQMNKSFSYGGVMANQIATLEHIGLFDAPVRMRTPLLDPAGTGAQTLEARARSYLHANCAICHRPEGDYQDIDMRMGIALKDTGLCEAPNKGDFNIPDAKRLFPLTPSKSVMYLRMQALDKKAGRMPQLATSVIDPTGSTVISDWIKSIRTCP